MVKFSLYKRLQSRVFIFALCLLCLIMNAQVLTMKSWSLLEHKEYFVHSLPLESYAGQIPIHRPDQNNTTQNMFFWYFPPAVKTGPQTPLILWIQGGPGASSAIGLFAEHGPLEIVNGKLRKRLESWNEKYGVIYVDNPVGTGYSTAFNDNINHCLNIVYNDDIPRYCESFAANQLAVAADMLIFLQEFFLKFPELKDSPLFLSGESYAGKYLPNIASVLVKEESINLKGVMIGDGLIDPPSQIHSTVEQALQYGLISPNQANTLIAIASDAIKAARDLNYLQAADFRNLLFQKLEEYSGGISWYDIRKESVESPWEHIETFMQLESTKKALHIPLNSNFSIRNQLVKKVLHGDIFKSSADKLDFLLESGIPVLIFAGQFDVRDGIPGQYSIISNLKWPLLPKFLNSPRIAWTDGSNTFGYITSFNLLSLVELRNAGHLAAMDQSRVCKSLIEALGTVLEINLPSQKSGFTLLIGNGDTVCADLKLGDSIAINGTCLTVIDLSNSTFKVGISPETLDKTCLDLLSIGDLVNLERAMLSTQRLGGHIVQGHVDCTVKILSIDSVEKSLVFTFSITDPTLLSMIVKKGYVCLDGVSLTVTQVDYKRLLFSIMMIEYTQEKVSLSRKRIGDLVNLEVDATFKHLSGMMMSFIAQDSSPIKDYIKACIKECIRQENL